MMNYEPFQAKFDVPGFESVVEKAVVAFLKTPVVALHTAPDNCAPEPGVYGLYYRGFSDYEPYTFDANLNRDGWNRPTYIGRAFNLAARLGHHKNSIDEAINLHTEEFGCRFLVFARGGIEDLIYPTEQRLIRYYNPLWNNFLKGFGAKVVGGKRLSQAPSPWDMFHPGRSGRANARDDEARLERLLAKLRKDQFYDPPMR